PSSVAELLDHAPVGLWTAGADGSRTYFNRQWLAFTGRSLEVERDNGWTEGVHPDDFERCLGTYLRAVHGRRAYDIEYRLRRFDGEYRWMHDTGIPHYSEDGTFLAYVGSAVDITERKRAQDERERLLIDAEAASRAKDQFLATLSHELRTPLNAVVGWAHMLRSGKLDEAATTRAIETIDRNARAQSQLISDILDISRIVSGKLRLNVRPVDLVPVVEAAIDTVRPSAEAKGIRLQVILDPAAGPVSGDADRLQQVVWNLLANAVKFTPRNGRVQVHLSRINSHVEVRVEDTGVGIGPEFIPHVFELFRQRDGSPSRQHGGLGLGLALVKHLVELHGGSVQSASPGEGMGAVFAVKLPLMVVAARDDGGVHPTAETGSGMPAPPSLEGVVVLVVDDDPDARHLIATLLEERGARVTTAASAEEALLALARAVPDVLLSDVEMPGQDGYAFMRTVRALPVDRGGRVPAAALTAYARTEDRMQALLAGFHLHMPKPVQPAELAAVVASLAGRTR
ncbi:MAG TPA: ATP-binding protein, partial [Vicinamibacteria bacterium]|nr:ATP-binding protein [Vicinamibacteria bacterium]